MICRSYISKSIACSSTKIWYHQDLVSEFPITEIPNTKLLYLQRLQGSSEDRYVLSHRRGRICWIHYQTKQTPSGDLDIIFTSFPLSVPPMFIRNIRLSSLNNALASDYVLRSFILPNIVIQNAQRPRSYLAFRELSPQEDTIGQIRKQFFQPSTTPYQHGSFTSSTGTLLRQFPHLHLLTQGTH